ncbi:hypothetical protein COSO111634_34120 [Corallococcus soli]
MLVSSTSAMPLVIPSIAPASFPTAPRPRPTPATHAAMLAPARFVAGERDWSLATTCSMTFATFFTRGTKRSPSSAASVMSRSLMRSV